MISIIIPVYNRAHLIPRALDSIKSQSFLDWECLVVDDRSTDDIKQVIDNYSNNDQRFVYILNTRSKGAQGARNAGILVAKGEWVVLFDSDNVMHPNFLESLIDIQADQKADVCSSWSNVIEESTGEVIGAFKWSGYGNVHSALLEGKSYFDNSSTLIRRQLLLDIGLLDESCPAFQEWDTHIRLSNNAVYTTKQECLVDYYSGLADSISSSGKKDVKGYLFILNKFKKEWNNKHKFYYLKYCAILKMKMLDLRVDKKVEEEYNQLVTKYENAMVFVFMNIMKFKQKLKRLNK